MGYASVFPSEVQPLIPQLDSIWLYIHVTMVALGYAFFAVGFLAGLLHLLRSVRWDAGAPRRPQRWLEFTMASIVIVVGFISIVFIFRGAGYEVIIDQKVESVKNGQIETRLEKVTYQMPPLVAPYNSDSASFEEGAELYRHFASAHGSAKLDEGVQAGRKLNTVIWSLLAGLALYGLIRLLIRKPIAKSIQPLVRGVDPEPGR